MWTYLSSNIIMCENWKQTFAWWICWIISVAEWKLICLLCVTHYASAANGTIDWKGLKTATVSRFLRRFYQVKGGFKNKRWEQQNNFDKLSFHTSTDDRMAHHYHQHSVAGFLNHIYFSLHFLYKCCFEDE